MDGASVRVRFTTQHADIRVTDAPIAVPLTLSSGGLSEVICHLLGAGAPPDARFTFLLKDANAVIASDLGGALASAKVGVEDIVEIEYFPEYKKPEASDGEQLPEWVSAVAAYGGAQSAADAFFVSACYDGTVRLHSAADGRVIAARQAHLEPVKAVAALGAEGIVASGGQDMAIKVSQATAAPVRGGDPRRCR